jgi:hypothetical protein
VFAPTSASGSSIAQWKRSAPGWMTSSAPANPPITQVHCSGDTCSPSDVAAASVMTSGVIITSAVYSPTGMARRLK